MGHLNHGHEMKINQFEFCDRQMTVTFPQNMLIAAPMKKLKKSFSSRLNKEKS